MTKEWVKYVREHAGIVDLGLDGDLGEQISLGVAMEISRVIYAHKTRQDRNFFLNLYRLIKAIAASDDRSNKDE